MQGRIEVICGCMFSGKSEELIRRVRRAKIAKQEVVVFKPNIDDRYSKTQVSSHGRDVVDAIVVDSVEDMRKTLRLRRTVQVVAIDEGQFLGPKLVDFCEELAAANIRVLISGLDQDYQGQPFGPMPQLLAIADTVQKLDAVCVVCGGAATKTFRTTESRALVQVGGLNKYEARCRRCHALAAKSKPKT
jgi:thymidine kinase